MSGPQVTLRAVGLSRDFAGPVETIRALDSVAFELQRGEHAVLMGPSGSGKTTLLHLVAGLDAPSAGFVEWRGQRLDTRSEGELCAWRAREIGIVFQDFGIVRSLSAADNVRLPLLLGGALEHSRPRAAEVLGRVGLGDRARHFPHQLSRGELQRVAVARALVHRPSLLLADEPTGSLDSDATHALLELFEALRRESDLTVLVATHDRAWAARADRCLELQSGRLQSA